MDFAKTRLSNESADDTPPHKKCLSLEARHSKAIESARKIRLNLKPSIFIPKFPIKSAKFPWTSSTKSPKIQQIPQKPSNRRAVPFKTSQITEDPKLHKTLHSVKRKLKCNRSKKEANNRRKPQIIEEYRKIKMRTYENNFEDFFLNDRTIEDTLKNMGLEIIPTEQSESASINESGQDILQNLSSNEALDCLRSLGENNKESTDSEIIDLDSSLEQTNQSLSSQEAPDCLRSLGENTKESTDPEIIDLDSSLEQTNQTADRLTPLEETPTKDMAANCQNHVTSVPPPSQSHTEITQNIYSYNEALHAVREFQDILKTSHSDFTSAIDQGIFCDLRAIQDSVNDFSIFLHNTYMDLELFDLEQSQILHNFEAKQATLSTRLQATEVSSEFVVRIDVPEMPEQILTFRAAEIMQCTLDNYEQSGEGHGRGDSRKEPSQQNALETPQIDAQTPADTVAQTLANSSTPQPANTKQQTQISIHVGPTNNAQQRKTETPSRYHATPSPLHLPVPGHQTHVPTPANVHPAYRSETLTTCGATLNPQHLPVPGHQTLGPTPANVDPTFRSETLTTCGGTSNAQNSPVPKYHQQIAPQQTNLQTYLEPPYRGQTVTTCQGSPNVPQTFHAPPNQSPQMQSPSNVHPAYRSESLTTCHATASAQNSQNPKNHHQGPSHRTHPQLYTDPVYANESLYKNVPAHQSQVPNTPGFNNNPQTSNTQLLPRPAQQSSIPATAHTADNQHMRQGSDIVHPAYRSRQPQTSDDQPQDHPHAGLTINQQTYSEPMASPTHRNQALSSYRGPHHSPVSAHQPTVHSNTSPDRNQALVNCHGPQHSPVSTHQPTVPANTSPNAFRNQALGSYNGPQHSPVSAHQVAVPSNTSPNINRALGNYHGPQHSSVSTHQATVPSNTSPNINQTLGSYHGPQHSPVSTHQPTIPANTTPNNFTVPKVKIKTIEAARKLDAKRRKLEKKEQKLQSRTHVPKHSENNMQPLNTTARPTVINRCQKGEHLSNAAPATITNNPSPKPPQSVARNETTFVRPSSPPYPIHPSLTREQFTNSPPTNSTNNPSLILPQSVERQHKNFKMPTAHLPPPRQPPPSYPIHPSQMRDYLMNFLPGNINTHLSPMPPQQNWFLRTTLLHQPRPSPPYQIHPSLGMNPFTPPITDNPLLTPPQSVDGQPSPFYRPVPYYAYSGCDPSIGVPMTPPSDDIVRPDVTNQNPAAFGVYNQDGRPYLFKEMEYPPCPPAAHWENTLPMPGLYNP